MLTSVTITRLEKARPTTASTWTSSWAADWLHFGSSRGWLPRFFLRRGWSGTRARLATMALFAAGLRSRRSRRGERPVDDHGLHQNRHRESSGEVRTRDVAELGDFGERHCRAGAHQLLTV